MDVGHSLSNPRLPEATRSVKWESLWIRGEMLRPAHLYA
jgi:hypothetical protein